MSHRSLRSPLVPLALGLAAAIAICTVAGSIGFGANGARVVTVAADISSAAPPARPAAASTLAGSLVRDIVAALGALIALVIVLLLIMSSRRRRALAGSDPGTARPRSHRGQHGHRRTGQDLRSAPPLKPLQHPGSTQETDRPTRPQLPTPAPAVSWPAPGGWQGGSVGEIAQPPAAPVRPVISAVARLAAASRSGAGMPSGPPWAPAQEPETTFGPLPVAPVSSFAPTPGDGIRVPPDVTGPPATTTGQAAPRPDVFDPPVLPGSADSSAWPPLFDYTAPSPAEESRRGLGFAAAPVAAGYPATDKPGYDRPGVPAATPAGSHSWDLAATDVFPVIPSGPADPDDDAPGASGS